MPLSDCEDRQYELVVNDSSTGEKSLLILDLESATFFGQGSFLNRYVSAPVVAVHPHLYARTLTCSTFSYKLCREHLAPNVGISILSTSFLLVIRPLARATYFTFFYVPVHSIRNRLLVVFNGFLFVETIVYLDSFQCWISISILQYRRKAYAVDFVFHPKKKQIHAYSTPRR